MYGISCFLGDFKGKEGFIFDYILVSRLFLEIEFRVIGREGGRFFARLSLAFWGCSGRAFLY